MPPEHDSRYSEENFHTRHGDTNAACGTPRSGTDTHKLKFVSIELSIAQENKHFYRTDTEDEVLEKCITQKWPRSLGLPGKFNHEIIGEYVYRQ